MNSNRSLYTGTSWNDLVIGEQNADNLFDGYGHGLDILIGGNGNDTFKLIYEEAGLGDTVYGGWGVDTLDLSLADRGLSINLQEGIAGNVVYDWDYEVLGPNWDGFEPGHPERVEVSVVFNSIENAVGTAYDDRIFGNDADNVLEGGGGADVIYGGRGNDTASYVNSDSGVFVSLGGLQSAVGDMSERIGFGYGGDAQGDALVSIENVIGSAYNDTFFGSRASNTFTGGAGTDTFVFGRNNGHDRITDFDAAGFDHDTIRLEGLFDSWNDLRNNLQQSGNDVIIQIDNYNSITLENVGFNQLGASDFDLV